MYFIEDYVDNLFEDIPETQRVKDIKQDLKTTYTKRYDGLINEGKTNSEALSIVISEIGEADELLEDRHYDMHFDPQLDVTHVMNEVKTYLKASRRAANVIGIGIIILLIGVSMPMVFDSFIGGVNFDIGMVLFFLLVASGIGALIYGGMNLSNTEEEYKINDGAFFLPRVAREQVEDDYYQFKRRNLFRIPLGVFICIISPILVISLAIMENDQFLTRLGVPVMLLLVGVGVYLFITFGMEDVAYQKMLNLGDYSSESRKADQRISPYSGIYWIIITIIYFVWSFTTNNWHITWIVWPIASLVWSLIYQLLRLRQTK